MVVVLACLPLLAEAARSEDALAVEEVADGVYLHTGQHRNFDEAGHDDIANIGFIVGDRCVAVIDSGGSVRIGRALRAAIEARSARPVCYVINTHGHVDHVLGNAAFAGGDTEFVGHAGLPAALARSTPMFLREYAGDLAAPRSEAQIVSPSLTVEQTRSLDIGGRVLRLQAWPRSHTDGDLSVYDEKTGTLWTGDLLFRGRLPALDGHLVGWLQVMDELAGLGPRLTIPGHGAPAESLPAALAPQRDYLQALAAELRLAIEQGRSVSEAMQTVAAEQRRDWLLWEPTHARNVSRAYRELEWE